MLLETLPPLALTLGICLIVLSFGAKTSLSAAEFLFRRPRLLLRTVVAIFVVVPAFVMALSSLLPIAPQMPQIMFALIALAASPIAPVLPAMQMRLGARGELVIGLLVAVSLISIVATPLLLGLASTAFGIDAAISPLATARTVGMSVALPLAIGIGLRLVAVEMADVISRYAYMLGFSLLLIGLLVSVAFTWRDIIRLVGNGVIAAVVATVVVGLVAGHLIAEQEDTHGALALAAVMRHPGVAIAMGVAGFSQQQANVTAAILLFLLVNMAAIAPYAQWAKRRAKLPRDRFSLSRF